MCPNTIPIRLTLEELCAAALEEGADHLENAMDADSFVSAVTTNHLVWVALDGLVEDGRLHIKPRAVRDALRLSSNSDHGTSDQMVADLMGINRTVAAELTAPANLHAILDRINMAYRESGSQAGKMQWLFDSICRRKSLPV